MLFDIEGSTLGWDRLTSRQVIWGYGPASVGLLTPWVIADENIRANLLGADLAPGLAAVRWIGEEIWVATVGGNGVFLDGLASASLKQFHDGAVALNLAYAVHPRAQGKKIGRLLAALVTFEAMKELRASQRPEAGDDLLVSVQTRSANVASQRVAEALQMARVPAHDFTARLKSEEEVAYIGFALPWGQFASCQEGWMSKRFRYCPQAEQDAVPPPAMGHTAALRGSQRWW